MEVACTFQAAGSISISRSESIELGLFPSSDTYTSKSYSMTTEWTARFPRGFSVSLEITADQLVAVTWELSKLVVCVLLI